MKPIKDPQVSTCSPRQLLSLNCCSCLVQLDTSCAKSLCWPAASTATRRGRRTPGKMSFQRSPALGVWWWCTIPDKKGTVNRTVAWVRREFQSLLMSDFGQMGGHKLCVRILLRIISSCFSVAECSGGTQRERGTLLSSALSCAWWKRSGSIFGASADGPWGCCRASPQTQLSTRTANARHSTAHCPAHRWAWLTPRGREGCQEEGGEERGELSLAALSRRALSGQTTLQGHMYRLITESEVQLERISDWSPKRRPTVTSTSFILNPPPNPPYSWKCLAGIRREGWSFPSWRVKNIARQNSLLLGLSWSWQEFERNKPRIYLSGAETDLNTL